MFTKPLRELTLTEALTPTPGRLASLRPAALMGGQFLPGAIACRATVGATITRDRPPRASPTRTPIPTLEEAGRLRPLPRHDVPLPRLQSARHPLRRRPHDPVALRADGGIQPEMSMPKTPLAQNVLGRPKWLARRATRRRHHRLDRTRRPATTSPHRAAACCSPNSANPPQPWSPRAVPTGAHRRADHATPQDHPRPRPRQPHPTRTRTQRKLASAEVGEEGLELRDEVGAEVLGRTAHPGLHVSGVLVGEHLERTLTTPS